MSNDMLILCREYDAIIERILPGREAFLPNRNGTHYGKSRTNDWFHKFWDSLPEAKAVKGNPARLHDLRHTFATHALASGVDAKTLSGILGHTKASFTLDTYAHVTGDMQRQAAQVMDTFMTDIFGKELTPWQSGESPAAAAST